MTLQGADPKGPQICLRDFNGLEIIGRGSFGKVAMMLPSRADMGLGLGPVAVKQVPKRNYPSAKRCLHSALRERSMLYNVRGSPFCLNILCCFQSPSHLYFVTELYSGGTLNRHIKEAKNTIRGPHLVYLAAELTQAIGFIHSKMLMHRDIKPGNVVIRESGHVVLIDYGNAFHVDCLDSSVAHLATARYKAPEMYLEQKCEQGVDWWSLGVTLLTVLNRYNPLNRILPSKDKKQPTKDELRKVFREFNPDDHIPSHCTIRCRDFIRRLLTVNPRQRLGYRDGPDEVRRHKFFTDLFLDSKDWDKLDKHGFPPPIPPDIMLLPEDGRSCPASYSGSKRLEPLDLDPPIVFDHVHGHGPISETDPLPSDHSLDNTGNPRKRERDMPDWVKYIDGFDLAPTPPPPTADLQDPRSHSPTTR